MPVRFTKRAWHVPVVGASAGTAKGIEDVLEAVAQHRAHVEASGLGLARTKKRVEQVRHSVSEQLAERLWGPEGLRGRVESELARGASPHAIAAALLEEITHGLTRPAEVRG